MPGMPPSPGQMPMQGGMMPPPPSQIPMPGGMQPNPPPTNPYAEDPSMNDSLFMTDMPAPGKYGGFDASKPEKGMFDDSVMDDSVMDMSNMSIDMG